MSFRILGSGSSVPANTVTNDDLSKLVDTSDEWIVSKTGIKERHIMKDESLIDLAYAAAENALENASCKAEELDLIICATVAGDYKTPSLAAMLTCRLGVKCVAFDLNSACSGFIYSLDAAAGFFARGKAKKALIVGAEAMSRNVDWEDRATCVLFGDGAGAVVIGEGDGYLASKLTCEGNTEVLNIGNSGSNLYNKTDGKQFLKMNGQEVYRFAVTSMSGDVADVIAAAKLSVGDISYILPHQANMRIIKAATDKIGIDKEKVLVNIERQGNLSSASIPVLLDEYNRKGAFKSGDILVLTAFGGGLTTGACVIRW